MAETYIQAIELCFDMKNYGYSKLLLPLLSILMAKVTVVHALSLLQKGNYSNAAT